MCCQSIETGFGMLNTPVLMLQHTSSSAAGMGACEFHVRLHGLRLTPLNRLCSQYICRTACSQGRPNVKTSMVQLQLAAAHQEKAIHWTTLL